MGNTVVGKFWSKMTGEQHNLRTPLLPNNFSSKKRTSINVIPHQHVSGQERTIRSSQQQPQTRSLMNKIRGREINTNARQLNKDDKEKIVSLLNKNTIFILQRHATSCANIINKGFETGSTSYLAFGKSRLVAEIAPDSMLSSIGIDECYQVHDYLTNNGTEITKLYDFDYLFCCSELIRTQQTMFLSYFDLIFKNNIKIMVLPWLNEERAVGEVNKDNLTISLIETKQRWRQFIEEQILKFPLLEKLKSTYIPGNKINKNEEDKLITQVRQTYNIEGEITIKSIGIKIEEEKDKYKKFLEWDNVFSLPDFIYRTPKGLDATFDKRVDLEKLYKIKMEESKIGLTRTKKSYNADDLLFALPFILYFSGIKSKLRLKIFMTGHSRTMVKLINLITLRSAITGDKSPYYSKPSLEKQQMMNAEIIQLNSVKLIRVIGGRDKFEKFEHLNSKNINNLSNKSSTNVQEIITTNFNLCRKFPVGFSDHVISKQLKDETFKQIKPFYFFYNNNLGIVYSLVDIVEQKIETKNEKLYKEGYPLRVFFGMTLLQYIGYLMVAKAVVSEMKETFKEKPKYDYPGLLDKISELENNIHIYVGDTENVSLTQNFRKLSPNPVRNLSQQPQQSQKTNKLIKLTKTITDSSFNIESLNKITYKSKNDKDSFSIKKIIDNYLTSANIDSINIDDIDNIIIKMLKNANVHNEWINDHLKTYTKYWFCEKLLNKFPTSKQNGGQNTSSIEIKYMEKNATEYFDKKATKFPKYSTTIKQYLFDRLPELRNITDRQKKRKRFVELLHTSLLSTCNINDEQKNKITTFMKNSFPTGLLEQQSQTPTRENTNKGQGMLERVEKLNERTGNNINKLILHFIPVPFIPLGKDGNNQLDKIIEHMKNMGGFYIKSDQTKDLNFHQIYRDVKRSHIQSILKYIYPSINDSVIKYIINYIYKINITLTNFNIFYSQTVRYIYDLIILFYSNYGIQYIFDNYKNIAIMFSIIENIGINIGLLLFEGETKNNISVMSFVGLFFSLKFLSLELYKNAHEKYTNEEIINNIRRCYYYTIYKNTGYYEEYGLCFFYFSLYIPDLIYYMTDNNDLNTKKFNPANQEKIYKKKVEYLFNLSDVEIKEKGKTVIDKFMTKFRDSIIKCYSEKYFTLLKSNKLNTNKLYVNYIKDENPYYNSSIIIKNEYYIKENSNNQKNTFETNFKKVIELITEPVHFESNEKAIATISGIPAKFDKNLVSSHYFAFEFNLDKIKEVCSKGLMKFSKKDCIQFVKADISNIMEVVKLLFNTEFNIWKYFVEIQVSLIKEGYVFASQEINTLIYISRLFGSSFDSILEIFYQSFPYMMFCFEYVAKIANDIYNIRIQPCQILNELFDNIGLEKMIILYKYLNITNIEIMEYIKKYGIIFLIYALLTPFHIFQTELTGKNINLHKQVIIDKLKAMKNFELAKQVKSVFDDKKIIEFIRKVGENKNDIFGKVSVSHNNNINSFNLSKVSNNGTQYNGKNKPSIPNVSQNETKVQQNADFIWSVFTIQFVPITVDGNRNVLDEIIAFYKTEKVGVYKGKIVKQVTRDYSDNKNAFIIICMNYLKMTDKQSIKFYDSYWRNILETYENLNIPYSQNHKLFAYISLFYKYDKLEFFRNNFLITSLLYEFGTSIEFSFFLANYYKLSILSSNEERKKFNNSGNDTYITVQNILSIGNNGSGGHIIDNIFKYISEEYYNIDLIKENVETILYYILNYNDIYILELYKKQGYGILCLFFLKDLPNYILYDDYTKNPKLMNEYGHPLNNVVKEYRGTKSYNITCQLRNIDYILELSKDKKKYEEKSKYIINEYLPKYIEYFNNQTKKLKSVKNNKNINKIMKFNETNKKGIFTNGSQNVSNDQHEKPADSVVINKATQLLTQGVYFLS